MSYTIKTTCVNENGESTTAYSAREYDTIDDALAKVKAGTGYDFDSGVSVKSEVVDTATIKRVI